MKDGSRVNSNYTTVSLVPERKQLTRCRNRSTDTDSPSLTSSQIVGGWKVVVTVACEVIYSFLPYRDALNSFSLHLLSARTCIIDAGLRGSNLTFLEHTEAMTTYFNHDQNLTGTEARLWTHGHEPKASPSASQVNMHQPAYQLGISSVATVK